MAEYQACPKCGEQNATKMSFTWWGGVVGPKILSHVKCGLCGAQYNGKTGKDNTTGITIYSVIVFAIVAAFLVIAVAAILVLLMLD